MGDRPQQPRLQDDLAPTVTVPVCLRSGFERKHLRHLHSQLAVVHEPRELRELGSIRLDNEESRAETAALWKGDLRWSGQADQTAAIVEDGDRRLGNLASDVVEHDIDLADDLLNGVAL